LTSARTWDIVTQYAALAIRRMEMKTKCCSKCATTKTLDAFAVEPRSKDGRRYSCRECDRMRNRTYIAKHRERRNAEARARRKENPTQDRLYQEGYRRRHPWKLILRHASQRAQKMGLAFDLDQHVVALTKRLSAMRCEMTGLPLTQGRGTLGARKWNSPSLDRIDPAKGYAYSNIRIVCWGMNAAMGTWGEGVLRMMVAAWQKEK
jgi:hypothetical protein